MSRHSGDEMAEQDAIRERLLDHPSCGNGNRFAEIDLAGARYAAYRRDDRLAFAVTPEGQGQGEERLAREQRGSEAAIAVGIPCTVIADGHCVAWLTKPKKIRGAVATAQKKSPRTPLGADSTGDLARPTCEPGPPSRSAEGLAQIV